MTQGPSTFQQVLEDFASGGPATPERLRELIALCQRHDYPYAEVLNGLRTLGHDDLAASLAVGLLDADTFDPHVLFFVVQVFFQSVVPPFVTEAVERCLVANPEAVMAYDQLAHTVYAFLAYAYKLSDAPEKVPDVLRRGREHCGHVINYQAAMSNILPDDIAAQTLVEERATDGGDLADGVEACQPSPGEMVLETGRAQEIGLGGAVLSASVGHAAPGAQYAFAYGYASDALDQMTPWQPVPPGCFSEVRDSTLGTFKSWLCYGTDHEFATAPCAVTSKAPFANDRNHLDGVGTFTLMYGWRPSALPEGEHPSASRMHAIDLRGGAVGFHLRHADVDSKGAALVLGAASHETGTKGDDWFASQWMMTGAPMPCAAQTAGAWEELTFAIEADPSYWSFGANNPKEQDNWNRYVYAPLESIVDAHNGNFTVNLMFPAGDDTVEGAVSLRAGWARYRDWSMLRNGYGASLVAFPGDDEQAALKLTNGQYRGAADGWFMLHDGPLPQAKFVWELPEGAGPDGLVLVQHPQYPSALAQIYLREGGAGGKVVYAGMTALPNLGYDQPKRVFVSLPETEGATHLEINLMQGHKPEGLGLMGVELFGRFVPQVAVGVPVAVCTDLKRLKAGEVLHYRIVCRDGAGEHAGDVHTLALPGDAAPVLASLDPLDDPAGAWRVHGNAMGEETVLEAHLDGVLIAQRPFGTTGYRRHGVVHIPEDERGSGKTLRVQLKNASGSSEALERILD